jgi:hypothetical protein
MIRWPTRRASIAQHLTSASKRDLLQKREVRADLAELRRIRRDPTGFTGEAAAIWQFL